MESHLVLVAKYDKLRLLKEGITMKIVVALFWSFIYAMIVGFIGSALEGAKTTLLPLIAVYFVFALLVMLLINILTKDTEKS